MVFQTEAEERNGPYVHIDYSFHLGGGDTKFEYTYDEEGSLGSSVKSGLRNSLHSSYDFSDLAHQLQLEEDYSDVHSFGEHEEVPSWRLDPAVSEADWKMLIESVPDGSVTEYHVHQRVLAEGLKKSEFFVSLFNLSAGAKVDAGAESVSKIHANATQLIPDMLDYLYSVHDILNITTESAVGLRHLSQFFGIRSLATEVVSFIYEDMAIDTMKNYLLASMAFDDLQTQKLCAQRCAESIKEIQPYSGLLAEMDPSFMLDIISCPKADRKKCSAHMSKLVAVYCDLHRDIIDGSVFDELTSVEYLPTISEECVLQLLILEASMVPDARNETRCLTYLQKRCVDVVLPLIQFQAGINENERRQRAKKLRQIPKKVLVELLSHGLFPA